GRRAWPGGWAPGPRPGGAAPPAGGPTVTVPRDEWRKQQEQLDQLRRQLARPQPPSVCRLSGKVETRGSVEVVALRAVFEFRTTSPKTPIFIACRKGLFTAAALDGALPHFRPDSVDGYVVVAEAPGDHRLQLDLELPG